MKIRFAKQYVCYICGMHYTAKVVHNYVRCPRCEARQ